MNFICNETYSIASYDIQALKLGNLNNEFGNEMNPTWHTSFIICVCG